MPSIRRNRPGPLQSMHIKPNQIIAWITGTGFSFHVDWQPTKKQEPYIGMYELLNELPWTGIQLPHPNVKLFLQGPAAGLAIQFIIVSASFSPLSGQTGIELHLRQLHQLLDGQSFFLCQKPQPDVSDRDTGN